uniref:RNA polymerase sigma factor n=1 Tax=Flavobacterium sp. TaxID=239 RepID=UPI004049247C
MKTIQLSDSTLVKQYIAGDEKAISTLIARHQTKIYSFIYSKISDRDLTEDVFQDTFIKVINKLKSGNYNEEGKFLSWVMRIAHNLVVDYYRSSQKMPFNRDTDDYSVFYRMEDSDPTIEKRLISDQIDEHVRLMIEELPTEQKEVIVLRIYNEMSFMEIAEQTDVSINTALGRMRYAIINLRKMMETKKIILTH